jgi:hypothetical protein
MNEIRSYKIELKIKDRINLYISGALEWDQIFTKDAFYIQQNESLIQKNNVSPWKIFKYQKSIAYFMFSSLLMTSLVSVFVNSSTLKAVFLSQTCDAQCASIMSATSFVLLSSCLFLVAFPAFYFLARLFFLPKFTLKPGRPFIELIVFAMFAIVVVPTTYTFYSHPKIVRTISHWEKGTLNKETLAQIKYDFKNHRTAEVKKSVEED